MNAKRKYKLVADVSELSVQDKEYVARDTAMENAHPYFFGICRNGKLLSYMTYFLTEKNNEILVRWIRQKNQNKMDFVKDFGVGPAQCLMEHFIRKGISAFSFFNITVSGNSFIERLTKSKLCYIEGDKLKVKRKWVIQANRRLNLSKTKRPRQPIRKITRTKARQRMQVK